jgi:hypothetical protein
MIKADAEEAASIVGVVLSAILGVTPTRGRSGADLRTAIGDFQSRALPLIQYDQSGPPLARIFDLMRKGGASLAQVGLVRDVAAGAKPLTRGGVLMKNSLINLALATEARIIADTQFKSREDAEDLQQEMNEAFDAMEVIAADAMDSPTYRALIELHAAVTSYLVTTQRPLPYMLNFEFAAPASTLFFAYRLYDDASRADELREENHVVHPAFARPFGRALAS